MRSIQQSESILGLWRGITFTAFGLTGRMYNFLSAAGAGSIAATFCCPIWVVKTLFDKCYWIYIEKKERRRFYGVCRLHIGEYQKARFSLPYMNARIILRSRQTLSIFLRLVPASCLLQFYLSTRGTELNSFSCNVRGSAIQLNSLSRLFEHECAISARRGFKGAKV
ncbi:hypothetical protein PsorP6_017432 [Peronosclerospora sorghi]|uniref:Uncharacterized protein n=1 Tax=Peronosclerospora sorghi TaxID=230839 RepID=A0ACC0WMH1_9STRA|nr:hypothetical protein PsorP6_017432 [Peronosclerospora sorghi]